MIIIKKLKDLFAKDRESWSEDDVSYLVYKNRFNEVKPYEVLLLEKWETECEVFDLIDEKVKTFKLDNILKQCNSFEDSANEARRIQEQYQLIPRTKREKGWANRDGKFEVCFTGFAKSDKENLIQIAEENNMYVRTGVTNNLGLLVCGENAGWSKLQKASQLKVSKVYGVDGFSNFVETGDAAEE